MKPTRSRLCLFLIRVAIAVSWVIVALPLTAEPVDVPDKHHSGPFFKPEKPLTVGDEYDLPAGSAACARTLTADVVALDQVITFNRLGVFSASSMIFALERDVEPILGGTLAPGNVRLRLDKRPRPLVLRMNQGDCLEVTFTNYLAPARVDGQQPATRSASMFINGLSLYDEDSFGSYLGANDSSLAAPGETRVYTWYASEEGPFLFHSAATLTGTKGDAGQPVHGLFGVVNVEPAGSVWYRSQVTADELDYATISIDPDGNRRIDYEAVYPPAHPFAGRPVLAILDGDEIFHGDLNAIIADIPPGSFPPVTAAAPDNNGVARDRNDPFREFTIVYHDEIDVEHGFPLMTETGQLGRSVRDRKAINYGSGAIGPEIMSYGADTIVDGAFGSPHVPAGNARLCNDCKYEEAFLSSWAVGDPAMVVVRDDVADPCVGGEEEEDPLHPPPCDLAVTGEALAALYPDDPSNVHHSYLNDHVKMRMLHGGVEEHHVHHLHAHQWLHSQNDDNSTYFDSQAIGPGSAFTLDIAYNGGGNRNKTPGDAIFHCHFYPHFAQGMWELWRNHDVFEDGTRTLPDAEVPGGTPIPALVPVPGQAMAPPATASMPGYPFYIPGIAGHRPPHPPLDTVDDGGLPRHVVRGGTVLDAERGPFDREHLEMDALMLPETGTGLELSAMAFHAARFHSSVTPDGSVATFITNGLPPQAGAPYADPCVDDDGNPVGSPRTIKAADLQIDAIINKAGWHFPQTRLTTLWGDVAATQSGARAPEPFFIRANSNDCIEYHLTNLVPNYYDVDDFQVFTPTDVLGQHIHLVKFDVTASDGAANGWNYEDGSFSPDEVIERIDAINAFGGLDVGGGSRVPLTPEAHPYFGVVGAQTTIQRWWADPLLNALGEDRTIRTVFTHDHFGPSTHQQVGLYAGLVIEPSGSTWRNPESGEIMGGRFDGGPTSFRADILTADPDDSHREFMLEFQDFTLAYTADNVPINTPNREEEAGLPFVLAPGDEPEPEGVSANQVGTFSVNYRSEPIALRIRDPFNSDPDGSNGVQAPGNAGDLAFAYRSDVTRADPALNVQPAFYPPLTADVQPGDPFTPLLRAYEGDQVKVRILNGATKDGHNFSIHGLRWLHEPDVPSSGYRNAQMSAISEHFEFEVGALPEVSGFNKKADFLYQPGASTDDQWNGMWGILREYEGLRGDLLPLPNNPDGRLIFDDDDFQGFPSGVCPKGAPVRWEFVAAVEALHVLPEGALYYNEGQELRDPAALMYVQLGDLNPFTGKLKSDAPREPLILRANAGDCIKVVLFNLLSWQPPDLLGFMVYPMVVDFFNANQVHPSPRVGLHPQLVHYDVRTGNGVDVGFNAGSTVPPGGFRIYQWYAGTVEIGKFGKVTATPVEFGATNLIPADLLQHAHKGLVGSLIVEPEGSSWSYPVEGTRATADVSHPGGSFREFVMVFQDDVQTYLEADDGGGDDDDDDDLEVVIGPSGEELIPMLVEAESPQDSGNKAINYRLEPMWVRAGVELDEAEDIGDLELEGILSIAEAGEIETPLFEAPVGTPVRFRVLEPQGHSRNHTVSIQGHTWRHEPGNPNGDFIGSQGGHGPASHWDIVPLHGAGGAFGVPGDYLYRDHATGGFNGGIWGVFRVTEDAGVAQVVQE